MRRRPALLLPALLTACSGGPADTSGTGSATSTGEQTSEATAADTGTSVTPTGTPTTDEPPTTGTWTTGEPPTTGTDATTDEPTTDPLTSSTTGSTSDPGTTGTDTSTSTTNTTGTPGDCTPGDTQPCYGGPPGSEGVGLCTAGEQLCTPQGEWAACLGEVLPAAETCVTPGDEDCDGVDPCGGTGTYQWDHTFGSSSRENGLRVGFDGAGNVVLAANSKGDVDLGGGLLKGAGGFDILLAKFAPDGEHLWSKHYGDSADQFNDGHALHVDAAGEIVLSGDFAGKIDFGGGPLDASGNNDLFLVKLGPDGAHVWSKAFKASNGYAYPGAVTRDKTGNILLAGLFASSLDLGGGALTSAGLEDAFVAKLDADGKHVWSQRFGDPQSQYAQGIVTDVAGNVFMTGGFQGTVNFGNGPLVSGGDSDIFLARLDPKGTAVWSKRFGGPQIQAGRDLAIDAAGKLAITGDMQGTVDFGGGPLTGISFDACVAQFDSAGAHLWSRLLGDNHTASRAVAYDGLGQILLTGNFTDTVDFGGGPLVPEGGGDIFALKLDGAGKHVWSKRFGDFQIQIGSDIAGSTTGTVAITGQFVGGVNFGGGPSTSKGDYDIFLAVFGP